MWTESRKMVHIKLPLIPRYLFEKTWIIDCRLPEHVVCREWSGIDIYITSILRSWHELFSPEFVRKICSQSSCSINHSVHKVYVRNHQPIVSVRVNKRVNYRPSSRRAISRCCLFFFFSIPCPTLTLIFVCINNSRTFDDLCCFFLSVILLRSLACNSISSRSDNFHWRNCENDGKRRQENYYYTVLIFLDLSVLVLNEATDEMKSINMSRLKNWST